MLDNNYFPKHERTISLIVPVYNVDKYLNKCIDSLINQTYKDIEIILIDDGSTDKSGEICDNYCKVDERIKVIHKKNGGLSDARNVGIKAAVGENIMFLDSDDYFSTDMVNKMLNKMNEYSADIVACGYKKVYNDDGNCESNEKFEDILVNGHDFLMELYSGKYSDISFISVCKLFKKCLLTNNNINFPVGRYYEDTFTTHKIIYYANNIVINREPLYFYRMREGSITNSRLSEKKIIDGLDADFECIKTFEGDIDLINLAYKYYCHTIFKTYLNIHQSSNTSLEKRHFKNIVYETYKSVFIKYKHKVNMTFKYKILCRLFLFLPLVVGRIIR